jgi:hypothetical protein
VDRGSRVGEQEHLVNDAGFLAIWSDVRIEQETDYLHWLTREHTSERLGVEGFLRVRVYRSLEVGIRRYFIHYELRSPDVVGSAAYLARLNTPTPWSQRMSSIPTREKSLREHDRSYAGLLLIEGLDEASVAASVSRLGFSAPDNVYVQVFQLFPQGGKG